MNWKLPSSQVLQADSIELAVKTIVAVGQGAKTDREIAEAVGGVTSRQGRYYRRAGEILGFLQRTHANISEPSATGIRFLRAPAGGRKNLLITSIFHNPLFQRLLPFLESKGAIGASRLEIEQFLSKVVTLAPSTVERRSSSYIQWLVKLGLVHVTKNKVILAPLPAAAPILQMAQDSEPLFPKTYELKEYQQQAERILEKSGTVSYLVDQARVERARTSHKTLVNLMAGRLREAGSIPKSNRFVDLSARWQGSDYLFEMKSTTESNLESQIRRGLSQLYEYRFIQDARNAKLVLVLENSLPMKLGWIERYLTEDRGIFLVWDGNGTLNCSLQYRSNLGFLQ